MIVDDHEMIRHGMAMLINMEPDLEVCCDAGDGPEALDVIKNSVDVLLLDVTLKTVSGLEIVKSILHQFPFYLSCSFPCMMNQFMRKGRCVQARVAMS